MLRTLWFSGTFCPFGCQYLFRQARCLDRSPSFSCWLELRVLLFGFAAPTLMKEAAGVCPRPWRRGIQRRDGATSPLDIRSSGGERHSRHSQRHLAQPSQNSIFLWCWRMPERAANQQPLPDTETFCPVGAATMYRLCAGFAAVGGDRINLISVLTRALRGVAAVSQVGSNRSRVKLCAASMFQPRVSRTVDGMLPVCFMYSCCLHHPAFSYLRVLPCNIAPEASLLV